MADVFDQVASEQGKPPARPPVPAPSSRPRLKTQVKGDVFDQVSREPAVSTSGSPPAPDVLDQDKAITDAWAEKHPYLGPVARFLVSGGQNAGKTITDTPGAVYHAVTDPTKDDELGLTYGQRLVYRLGGKQAIEAGQDYAAGRVTPRGAVSVLPEALGTGLGQTSGGAVYGKLAETIPDVASASKPYATAPVRAGARLTEAVANSKLRPFAKVMTPADEALAARIKIPGRDLGLPDPTPPPVAPKFLPKNPGAKLPQNPGKAFLQQNAIDAIPPELRTPSRTLPGMNPPEVIRPPAQPIPARSGLALPPAPEEVTPQASSSRLIDQVNAWRSHSVGDEGIPYNQNSPAQATMSEADAQRLMPGREDVTGQPQELVNVDLSKTPGFSLRPGPSGADWVKFHGDVPDSAISRPRLADQIRESASASGPDIGLEKPYSPQGYRLLDQLRNYAQNLQSESAAGAGETTVPGENEDLTSLLTESVRRARAARGLPPVE